MQNNKAPAVNFKRERKKIQMMSPQFRQSIKYFRHNKKNHLSTIGTTELTFKKFEVNKSIDVYNRNGKF